MIVFDIAIAISIKTSGVQRQYKQILDFVITNTTLCIAFVIRGHCI